MERYDKAIETGEKALKLAKENGMPFMISWCYWFLAMNLRAAGDLRRAREYAEEALRISQECNEKAVEGHGTGTPWLHGGGNDPGHY